MCRATRRGAGQIAGSRRAPAERARVFANRAGVRPPVAVARSSGSAGSGGETGFGFRHDLLLSWRGACGYRRFRRSRGGIPARAGARPHKPVRAPGSGVCAAPAKPAPLMRAVPLRHWPVPVNCTVCLPGVASDSIVKLAVRVPVAEGVKLKATEQKPPGFSEVPQVLNAALKSPGLAPPNAKLLNVTGTVPALKMLSVPP